ncbi:hypothetical protein NKR19_g1415 [Coniochaeta hoffmannii]|uniref:Uncharacterized protein n=1 Tax=Coniochaeta hoffmannii TaxID=91930 RepID=A0AA38S0X0_9PEZI|nr:hypothetical protein NKR19_g1415 [Coniochaeta hoffmannii]
MGRSKNKPSQGKNAKRKERLKHPADKTNQQHTSPKIPKSSRPERVTHPSTLPRMKHFGAVAQISTTFDPLLVERARTTLWQSMPGFHFGPLPFLTHDETATLTSAFGLLGDSPKLGHDTFLVFLAELLDWMNAHEYAYCAQEEEEEGQADGKRVFYAFGRLEYYNSLAPLGGNRNRVTAHALAAIDVPLLIRLVEGFVRARRAFSDEETLEALGAAPADESKLSKKQLKRASREASRAMNEFEKAARALTARLDSQLTMDDGQDGLMEDEHNEADEGDEGAQETKKSRGSYWSSTLLKRLGVAVDRWLKCLENQEKRAGGLQWENVFGQTPASTKT